ncbi:MAG: O-antigen ligase family protein [Candidatus Rokubacteria bacterium]|nr:O-antigen ligase family protein [Candidatus Rokubacteria bacterium]
MGVLTARPDDVSTLSRIGVTAFLLGLGFSITLSQGALLLLTFLWLRRLRDPEARRAATWPLWAPVLGFSAVSLLSALASGHPRTSLVASKGLWLVAALYVAADVFTRSEVADRFLSALSLVVAAAALMGLLQVGFCPQPEPSEGLGRWFFHRCDRARGSFSIYMTLAGILNLLLLATLPRLLLGRRLWGLSFLAWLVTLLGLAVTYTRGAWLGFAAGVLALAPLIRRARWLLIGGLVVLLLGVLAGPQHLRQRFLSVGDRQDPTVKERVYMWRSGLALWQTRPWLGVGPGGVKREYQRYALPEAMKKRTGHVHNTPLQILVERGVIGLAAWLWIWGAFYARAVAILRRLPATAAQERALVAGSLAAITGFLVAGLTEYNFGDSEVVMVAWTIMALPFVVSREAGGA